MADENFDEWDPDFLDQLVQAEELALSAANPTIRQQHPLPRLPSPSPPPPPRYGNITYSPPSKLSQRPKDHVKDFDRPSNGAIALAPKIYDSRDVKDQEIDGLKIELGRALEQLTHLKQEIFELKKDKDKKGEQLKSIPPTIEAKDAEVPCSKTKYDYSGREHEAAAADHQGIYLGCQVANCSNILVGSRTNVGRSAKAVGVQTDEAGTSKNLCMIPHCPSKLLGIWDLRSGQDSRRNLVTKLLVACENDFRVLFGCLNSSLSHKTTMDSPAEEISFDVALQDQMLPVNSTEAAKVSNFYSMLTKISNRMVKLEAVLEALVDLCGVENVVIAYRSLRVLHAVLNHWFHMERKFDNRYNIMVEGLSFNDNIEKTRISESSENGDACRMIAYETLDHVRTPFGLTSFDPQNLCENETSDHGSLVSISSVDWISLFEMISQIATRNSSKHVRVEAVSNMNMIILRTNAYVERNKFGNMMVFQLISLLLSKDAGFDVQQQQQAVHLLYLLLNCPKLMAMFTSGCKEGESAGAASIDGKHASDFQAFSAILEGVADIVTCSGNSAQELKLRKHAVILLAFLASSGRPGFETLLSHGLQKSAGFLPLILQNLTCEMDVEATEAGEPPEIFKERTLLMRETLILLNRLASNPQYSTPVLRVLTNSREVACYTIDIANRLSRKSKWLWQSDSVTRQIREYEIVDLARVFKKRVFSFLGDSVSLQA